METKQKIQNPTRRLSPMDVVLYDGKLWVVSTAHKQDNQGRQEVSLAGYKRKEYRRHVTALLCRIVYDESNRERTEITDGFYYYPD